MSALSLAIIGKNNEPLYLKEFREVGFPLVVDDETLFGLSMRSHQDEKSSKDWSGGFACSSRYQFIMHAALDRLEQLAGPPPGYGWRKSSTIAGTDAMFVGLLQPMEEMRVYGMFQFGTEISCVSQSENEILKKLLQPC